MLTTYKICESSTTASLELKRKAPLELERNGDYDDTVDENGIPNAILYNRGSYFPDIAPQGLPDLSHDSNVENHYNLSVGQFFDALEYLFPSRQSDYLIRIKEDGKEESFQVKYLESKKYVIICTFFIPVMNTVVGEICCQLNDIITQLAKEKHDFVVVLVMRMRSDFPNYDNDQVAEAAFKHFFSAFSPLCLAVPISETVRSLNLFRVMGSSRYCDPGCIIIDLEKRELLYTEIYDFLIYGPDLYPFTDESHSEMGEQYDKIRSRKTPLETLLCRQSSDFLQCVCNAKSPCERKEILSSLTNKVVWLYILREGESLDKVLELSKLCKTKALEFTLVVVCANNYQVGEPTMPSLWRNVVLSRLQNPNCCGSWFLLPFDYRVSCRLRVLCPHYPYKDKLVVVGPNGSYVEPDGLEVFLDNGIDAYPFTKENLWKKKVARLRGLRLQDWLGCRGIFSLKRPNGEILSVSDLRDRDVLVYFGATASNGKRTWKWDDRLVNWVKEMKASSKRGLELIFMCLSECPKEGDTTSIKDHCSEMGWLLPDPYETDRNQALVTSTFDRLGVWIGWLAAFQGNGRLLRLAREYTLWRELKPATFPTSDDVLPRDIGWAMGAQFSDNLWFPGLDINQLLI